MKENISDLFADEKLIHRWIKEQKENDKKKGIKRKKLTKADKENFDNMMKIIRGELTIVKETKDGKCYTRETTDFEKTKSPIGMPKITKWLNKVCWKRDELEAEAKKGEVRLRRK